MLERIRQPSITAGLCPRPSTCWAHSFGSAALADVAAGRRLHHDHHEKDH